MINTTKLAIQASSAVIIIIFLGHFFPLEKVRWATLTALMLVSSTFGESIKKSCERVVMTLFAGLIATSIYYAFLIGHSHFLVAMLLVSVVLTVYFLAVSYAWATFFITFFVVFLFSLISEWDYQLLITRSYETIIGAVVAVVVSGLILPAKTKKNILVNYSLILDDSKKLINELFICFAMKDKNRTTILEKRQNEYYLNCKRLKIKQKFTSFELVFSPKGRRKMKEYELCFDVLLHYLTNIIELIKTPPSLLCIQYSNEVKPMQLVIIQNMRTLNNNMIGDIAMSSGEKLDILNDSIGIKVSHYIQQNKNINYQDVERFFSYIYYLRKVNKLLLDLISIEK